MTETKNSASRRDFLKNTVKAGVGAVALSGFPTIVPASVFGKNAPSNKINIGQIGIGRIARTHDLAETFKYDNARIIGVADVDRTRDQYQRADVKRKEPGAGAFGGPADADKHTAVHADYRQKSQSGRNRDFDCPVGRTRPTGLMHIFTHRSS